MNAQVQEVPVEKTEEVNELLVMVDDHITATNIFADETKLEDLLQQVEDYATSIVPDLTTVAGRKAIAATAYNVARSKTALEKFGKALVAEQKAEIKKVDNQRKYARERLDEIKNAVRKPLTDWEAEQERIAQEEADRAKLEADEEEAYAMDVNWENERKLREAQEKLDRLEREKRERELKKEAEEKARKEAHKEIELRERREREDAERRERDAARKVQEAEERAKRAEEEAAEQARQAVEDERVRKAAEDERRRLEEKRLKEEAEEKERLRAANVEHRRGINNRIVERLQHYGFTLEQSQAIVQLIATGKIPSTEIRY